MTPWTTWVAFNLFVLALLALDLGVFHRRSHAVKLREAVTWSLVWVALALGFCVLLFSWRGTQPALQFLSGYLIEKSLSVDNLFVFLLIFSSLAVPAKYQHKVLFWGILSALLMRGAMIALGTALIARFHWALYLFGAFLVLTGLRMAVKDDEQGDPQQSPPARWLRRVLPVAEGYHGGRFWVRQDGRWLATPLFLALALVEFADLIFAVDSIPAVFAVTDDPFIIYTANVFAILGLRSLFFALAGAMTRFHYLKYGLAAVLVFVGIKMLLDGIYPLPTALSLGVIAAILAVAVLASLRPAARRSPARS
jgi:tellurite resistance protein TerC